MQLSFLDLTQNLSSNSKGTTKFIRTIDQLFHMLNCNLIYTTALTPFTDKTSIQFILLKGIHVTNIIIQYYLMLSSWQRIYMLALLHRRCWIIQANSAVRKKNTFVLCLLQKKESTSFGAENGQFT